VTIAGHAVSPAGVGDGKPDSSRVTLPPEQGRALQAVARSAAGEVRGNGGLPKNAGSPWPTPPPAGSARAGS
jgi:hypothetical protein